jgi:signal transduction histidine kinase/DNA-binding response OmpR family regulator
MYTLEGFDEDWYTTGSDRRFVTYTNLDPGKYVFRVKGSNNDGVWNSTGASVAITITPPFWKTWWAYILYALAISAAVVGAWRATLSRARTLDEMKLRRMESEKLQELDQLKSRFFANISHEFRTPLALILGPLEQSLAKVRDKALKQSLAIARRNAGRLLRLINQLLDLSKMETGSMKLEAREENLVPLLRRFVQTFESLAESKRITLRFHAPEDQVLVYIDRDKLEKIMSNLLSNALKFTPAGGIVDLTLTRTTAIAEPGMGGGVSQGPRADLVEIEVSDTGTGIPPDQIDKVFDRFYQVDGIHIREQEGTGIGLALSKELVELHHGEIAVSSAPGRGSRFTIRLPLGREHLSDSELGNSTGEYEIIDHDTATAEVEGAEPSDTMVTAETPTGSESTKSKVLIVEDNADMRHYIRSDLERDYSVQEAMDGDEGLQLARDQLPDLIISDVMMPGMDGFELCEHLKTDERTSHIPVVLLTAKAGQGDKLEGLETGADDYLTKPFDVRELRTRVRNLIDQRRRLRERFRRDVILDPKDITVTSMDERFLQRALDVIEAHMSEGDFGVAEFSQAVGMSRASLHNKLRALTGQPASDFIRTQRLIRAAQLLQKRFGNVTEVAFEVGFSNPSYFSECFKKQFGQSPSRYSSSSSS